jgi:hypothetical protein
VTSTIVSKEQWPVAVAENVAGREPGISVPAKQGSTRGRMRSLLTLVDDVVLLLVLVFLFPLVILLIGAPVALFVRLLVEIARRL